MTKTKYDKDWSVLASELEKAAYCARNGLRIDLTPTAYKEAAEACRTVAKMESNVHEGQGEEMNEMFGHQADKFLEAAAELKRELNLVECYVIVVPNSDGCKDLLFFFALDGRYAAIGVNLDPRNNFYTLLEGAKRAVRDFVTESCCPTVW
jgi:hypothetical protein